LPIKSLNQNQNKKTMSTQKQYEGAKSKILAYLKENKDKKGAVPLNDFLKSLWPPAKQSEPHPYNNQGANAMLRGALSDLIQEGEIEVVNNQHLRLGENYYPTNDGKTHHHSLDSIKISAEYLGA
jgi:hypothetical protein